MKRALSIALAALVLLSSCGVAALALSGHVDPSVVAVSRQTAIDVEAEGIVLLKNEENCLPLCGKKLNIFGVGSVYPFLGGAGSGAITSDDPTDFYEALEAEGIAFNTELRALYEANIGRNKMPKTDNTVINNLLQVMLSIDSLKEMPVEKLTDDLMRRAVAFSDTALIMISRTSAEGADLSEETLRLSDTERALIEKVNAAFGEVIVLFNTGNVMQMDWLEQYDHIRAAAMMWIPGEFGFAAVAQMLSGKVNPSGRLADTVAYDPAAHASSPCFGSFKYQDDSGEHYVEYREGIYVGYRYFETFAPEKVQFPFGYGLSYTTFEQTLLESDTAGDDVRLSVQVTNTGERAGKETVQVYYSAPYTPGGLEKSAVCLGGFAKTGLLAPGESESVTVSFPKRDMASYDAAHAQSWVLEAGNYDIRLSRNAAQALQTVTVNVPETVVLRQDSATGADIQNRFDAAYSGFPVLSRADAAGTFPTAEPVATNDAVKNADQLPAPTTEGTAPKTGARYEKTITLRDVAADASLWDAFLDQLTVREMALLVSDGGYGTAGIDRLGIPATMDNDGPSSVKGRNGILYTDSGVAYPCETAIACTWNIELAEAVGAAVGMESADIGTDIWYAPAVNLHRNPRGGRNFEYFSEDPLLSGKLAAAMINGCSSEGLVVTIKHFALNDQESHRNGVFTWADEQTMRELYLKAFEIAIKESDCAGVMSAYNRIGPDWCGGCKALLIDLLRAEWGFDGFVVSDFTANVLGTGYMNPVLGVYNGNDTILTGIRLVFLPSHMIVLQNAYRRDPIGFGTALRMRCKELCMAKMKTRAFLQPERQYDDSLSAALVPLSEWEFQLPYGFSFLRYLLNNLTYLVLYALRGVCG
ncbi:MAG: glycoside hydrolase family 3 protein [Clostridia bacterium]|nr:glycoside hydrolase family 3 protein [Clostridia bacterium]